MYINTYTNICGITSSDEYQFFFVDILLVYIKSNTFLKKIDIVRSYVLFFVLFIEIKRMEME